MDLTRVSEDSRKRVERLRRAELWKFCESEGIPIPPGAPKTMMVPIVEALPDSDAKLSRFFNWIPVRGKNSEGQDHTEYYPEREQNVTAGKNIPYDDIIEKRANRERDAEEVKFKDVRIEALERENRELRDTIEKRLSMLEKPAPTTAAGIDITELLPWQLKKLCAKRGIQTSGFGNDKKKYLDALGSTATE